MSAMPNGGTSNTLHYKLEGNIENQTQSDILTYTSVGPVVQFLLPRNNEENLKEPIAKFENPEEIAVFYWSKHDLWDEKTMSYFFPDRSLMTEKNRCKTSVSSIPDIVDVFDRIGNLNWYSVKYSHKRQKKFDESRFFLFKERRNVQDYYDAETEALVQHFTYIDKLAEQFKSRMKKIVDIYFVGIILFFVSSAVLSSFWEIHLNKWENGPISKSFNNETHTCNNEVLAYNNETPTRNNESHSWCDMYNLSPFWTITYWSSIILFFSVYCLTKWLWKNRVRFYRFRTVAGALKVQIFWRIAEMSDCVSGHYRTHQLPDTEWLRAAINGLDVLFSSPEAKNIERTLADRLIFVRDKWIQEQLMYYQGKLKSDKEERSNLILELTMLAFWLFIFFSFPLIPAWLDFLHENHSVLSECCQVVYDLVLVIFPIYGFYLFWTKVYQPQSELNRYKQMLFPFDQAILLMNSELEKMNPQDFENAQKTDDSIEKITTILRQLGTESVSENASWYLSLGERKLILPH